MCVTCLIFSLYLGYYLEVLVAVGLFCKEPLKATLRGVTSNSIDPSVDHIKVSAIPVLKRFIIDDEGLELKISKRGKSSIIIINVFDFTKFFT